MTTGDGQLSAIQLLSLLKKSGKKLSQLAGIMKKYPQVLVNIKLTAEGRARYNDDEVIKKKIEAHEDELGENGRVLVRLSGTEPLVRVMVEGTTKEEIEKIADDIASVIKERLA